MARGSNIDTENETWQFTDVVWLSDMRFAHTIPYRTHADACNEEQYTKEQYTQLASWTAWKKRRTDALQSCMPECAQEVLTPSNLTPLSYPEIFTYTNQLRVGGHRRLLDL